MKWRIELNPSSFCGIIGAHTILADSFASDGGSIYFYNEFEGDKTLVRAYAQGSWLFVRDEKENDE